MTQKLVVIGAGMASGRVLEHLIENGADYDVTLFNAEQRGNYNRIMLSPVLSGEKSYEEIITHDDDWYASNAITCRFGEHVVGIDRARKVVIGQNGEVPYDKLLIATGSAPFIIPVQGKDLAGVITYRDMDDTQAMIEAAARGGRAVVIGGGLLGLEAAAGLKARGMEVTVVHLMDHLMERQLDEAAGYLLRTSLEEKGIEIKLGASTKAILGTENVEAVLLEDGEVIAADLVVMAVGIRPETRLATDARLEVARGVEVNTQMATSDPDILAVGECVEFDGQLFGLVAPLYDQAKVAAATLMGQDAVYVPRDTSTKLKVTGCDLFSAGDFAQGETREDIVFQDPGRGVYKRLVIEDNKVLGAVMYGDTGDGGYFFGLIKDGADISDKRDTLIFGPAFAGSGNADPLLAVAAFPDDTKIRGCNGVCKSTIVNAVKNDATTLGKINTQTKASDSCGICTGLVDTVSLTAGSAA